MPNRDTRTDLRATNGPSWKWIAGVAIGVIMAGAGWAMSQAFYSRAEGVRLEQKHEDHCKEADYRNLIQDEQNARVNTDIKDLKSEQRRTSDNVIRIGEKLRVRDLDLGDPE